MLKPVRLINALNLRKNVRYSVVEFIVNMTLLFFSYRLLIKTGGVEVVGVWATLYAWTAVIRIGDAGVASAAARFVALRDVDVQRAEVRTYAETAMLTNIAQFTILALVGYIALSAFLEAIVGTQHTSVARSVLPLMMTSFVLANVSGTTLAVLQGVHLGFRRSQLSVLGTSVQLVAVLVLVPIYGLMGLALAQILQHLVTGVIGWLVVRRLLVAAIFPYRFSVAAFKDMLGYSIKAQAVNVANGLVEPISKIIVGHYGGMAVQGIYELAYKTVLVPRNLMGVAVASTMPAMARCYASDRPQLAIIYRNTFRWSVIGMGSAAGMLVAFSPIPSYLWLRELNHTYMAYVAIIAAGFLLNAVGVSSYVISLATGKFRGTMIATVSTILFLVAFGPFAGIYFGGLGAVVACAGCVGYCGLFVWMANKPLIASLSLREGR